MKRILVVQAPAVRRWVTAALAVFVLGATPGALGQTLEWSPESMFLDNVTVGTTAWGTLTLTASVAPVTVSSIEWTYNQPGTFSGIPLFGFEADRSVPATMLPGESMEIYISFTPEEAFSFASANLRVTNNSANAGILDYFVEGSGAEPSSCFPLASCGGICTDLENDLLNCGTCGNVCPTPSVGLAACNAGVCGFICDESIDLSSDPENCGSCGNVCDAPMHGTAFCEDGGCGFVCDEGYEIVGDTCEAIVVKTPEEIVDDLVQFVTEARDSGGLVGLGPSGKDQQAEKLLDVFIKHLVRAQLFIDNGLLAEACGRLNWDHLRSDGGWPFVMPPDMVAGEDASETHDRIVELMDLIGCEISEAPERP